MSRLTASRLVTPVVTVLTGLVMLGAAAAAGQVDTGIAMLAGTMVYAAVLVVLGGRSEIVGVLSGLPADERMASINVRATAVGGSVALIAALGGFIWEVAHGREGLEFVAIDVLGFAAYFAALVWLRWRG